MSRGMWVAYLGGSFATGVFNAFNNFTLSLWLTGFTTSYLLISLFGNSKSFEGALVAPFAGAWSDRTWAGWLGRRRVFMLTAGLTAALLLAFTPEIARLQVPAFGLPEGVARAIPAIIAIFLFTFAFNMQDDLHKALLADISEGKERNTLSSFAVVTDMGGQVFILALGFFLSVGGVSDIMFRIAACLVAGGILITVIGVKEPAPAVWREVRAGEEPEKSSGFAGLAILRQYRGAAVFCLVVFAYWAGVNAILPLISIYVRDILGASDGEAQLLPALLLLSTTIFALPFGWLGNRLGKRRVLAAGYVVMGFAAVAGLFITTKEQGAILFLIAGIGNAASMVLTVPLLADLVPRHYIGAATGLLAASTSISAPFASIIAGSLADAMGPRAIFLMMGVMVLVALGLLPAVRHTVAIPPASVPA